MTTIAYDGFTLAADRQSTNGGLPMAIQKIYFEDKKLIAGSGEAATFLEMLNWIRNGADPSKFPEKQKSNETYCAVIVIHEAGNAELYEVGPYPLPILTIPYAIGSGRDFAIAAMHLGKSAKEAVEIASLFDVHSGLGVDAYVVKDER